MAKEDAAPEKDAIKSFKTKMEESLLISAVLPEGPQIRSGLEALSGIVKLVIGWKGPESGLAETKYGFVKDALVVKKSCDHPEDLQKSLEYLQVFSGYKGDAGQLPLLANKLKDEMLAQAEAVVTNLKESFVSRMQQACVDVSVPEAVETITQEQITEDFLKTHFDMDRTKQISERTVQMATCLKDISVACSFMDIAETDFLDTKAFEMNHRSCVRYLRLVLI